MNLWHKPPNEFSILSHFNLNHKPLDYWILFSNIYQKFLMSENKVFCLVTHFHIALKKKKGKNTFIFQDMTWYQQKTCFA